MKKLLRINDISEMLGVSVSTINRMIARKEIPVFKLAGRNCFDIDDIRKWILSLKKRAQAGRGK
jgi:excisionase family DNA binding protein